MNSKLLLSLALAVLAVSAARAGDGFVPLFDGKTLAGWKNPYVWGQAEAVNGEIHLTGEQSFFLVTDKSYGDFILEADVLLPAEGEANSGFNFRSRMENGRVVGYQAEVDGDPQRQWSGGLQEAAGRKWFASPIKGDKASEEAFRARVGNAFKLHDWNTFRIECRGKSIKIFVNGVLTTDVEDDKHLTGIIALQHHGEKGQTYRFRNLKIQELK